MPPPDATAPPPPSQFRLLGQRRFGPFFLAQLAGAFNDSLLKQVVVLLVTFHAANYTTLDPGLVTNLAAGLFILPFVLFSATAGQLADALDKARLIRWVKGSELAIVGLAAAGFARQDLGLLLGAVFAMGTHSAFFGPVKYALLPQVLDRAELTGGNGLLEMGTFLSILGGTLVGGLLVAQTTSPLALSLATGTVALAGFLASLFVPSTAVAAPDLRPRWRPWTDTLATLRLARAEGVGVWNSLLAISWFWFLGALVLSQLPALGQAVLGGEPSVVTLLLAVFSVGVGLGSLACEKLSGGQVEIGLVPLGAFGMGVFLLDLVAAADAAAAARAALAGPLEAGGLVGLDGGLRLLADVALLGLFGGLFIVPLYAFVQLRSDPARQSRMISANNILNAVFMVAAAGLAAGLLAAGVPVLGLLLVSAALHLAVALHIGRTVPEFFWRFLSWALVRLAYRLRVQGRGHLPAEGAALMAPNHLSYVDALVLSALSPRPVRFVMDAGIFRHPLLGPLFRQVRAIPVAPRDEDPAVRAQAFEAIDAALAEGELVCLFPEGALSRDGRMRPFKPGILKVLARRPVPVVPVGLRGLWDSAFTRSARSWRQRLAGLRPGHAVTVQVGAPLPPTVDLATLQATVAALAGQDDPGGGTPTRPADGPLA